MAHNICHVEIPCKNIARARKFYSDIFGWKITDFGGMYAMFKTGEGPGGGLEQRADNFPTERAITLYIQVEDIDFYLTKISVAGGRTIQKKTEISKEFGYSGLFIDTEGNTIGLWSKT